ncbi:hypothetical protein [Fusibacter ferrireducens]|uniref:Uncharacterized protein n=1 Tax=Fusibacter ferrireducens TaxID=2785058 RepID=A0ABS0A075_9FIRM|nr:hypothetical protein [Fusibacter ferrireducens]MBF4696098.1 hypothetical protein [Fusibacter ferrireducens]
MNRTHEFQNEVTNCMNRYFYKMFEKLESEDEDLFRDLEINYFQEYNHVRNYNQERIRAFNESSFYEVLLSAISEPITNYNLSDYNDGDREELIYSPRIDIAFSPSIKTKRGKTESIGVYKLSNNVKLFKFLHKLNFVKEIENNIRNKSNDNLRNYGLDLCYVGCQLEHNENDYINKRPLHLFGIEIENQKNAKHLMGDFLNAISLSRIPIVIVPESRLDHLMKMLMFSSTIKNLKEVPIYDLLKTVNILTINQFISVLNDLLQREGLNQITIGD